MSGQSGYTLDRMGWMSCQNQGSSVIPAFAPMQVVGGFTNLGDEVLKVDQIGSSGNPSFNRRIVFNREFPIQPKSGSQGGFGTCTLTQPCWVAYDTGTPNPGDIFGIKSGQFSLTKNGVGSFQVFDVNTTDKRILGVWEGISSLITKYAGSTVPLTPGNTGTFNVWSGIAGSEVVTSGPWTVTGAVRFEPVDKTGFTELELVDGNWYALESEHLALQIYGTLTGTLTAGGSVTCSVTVNHNGASPGSTVTVYDPISDYTGSSGDKFQAHLNRTDGKYYFDWVCSS